MIFPFELRAIGTTSMSAIERSQFRLRQFATFDQSSIDSTPDGDCTVAPRGSTDATAVEETMPRHDGKLHAALD
jgi:hypothetical protein